MSSPRNGCTLFLQGTFFFPQRRFFTCLEVFNEAAMFVRRVLGLETAQLPMFNVLSLLPRL